MGNRVSRSSLCLSNLDVEPQLELTSHLVIVLSWAPRFCPCLSNAFPGSCDDTKMSVFANKTEHVVFLNHVID